MLPAGFTNAPHEAARAFRTALNVLARPGTIEEVGGVLPPAPLSVAAGVLILTLADRTTGIWLAPSLDRAEVRDWITFHTGAPFVAPQDAAFAIGDWAALLPAGRFAQGLPDYPDRSATLIAEVAALSGTGARLTGPGIETEAFLSLPETAAFAENAANFPLGVDFFFCAGNQLAGLPRTTRVEDV